MRHWDKIHSLYFALSECLTSFVLARSFFSGCFQFFLRVCLHLPSVHGPLNVPYS